MRISELSDRTGVTVPTLKFYLREGLLPPGTRTARNQARYDETHVRRVRLVRALMEVGRLSLAAVREIVAAVDAVEAGGGAASGPGARSPRHGAPHDVLGTAHRALAGSRLTGEPDSEAVAEVDRFLAARRWRVTADAPARLELAVALTTLRRLGWDVDATAFKPYADCAYRLAEHEVGRAVSAPTGSEAVEQVVVGTVVFEAVLVALRRLAQEHHSARRAGIGTPAAPRDAGPVATAPAGRPGGSGRAGR